MNKGVPMPTDAQRARRRTAAARLFQQGYNLRVIAQALGCGASVVGNDLHELGFKHLRRPLSQIRTDTPDPVDWMSEPVREQRAAYLTSAIILDLERWTQAYQEERYANRLAWQIDEALRAGDPEWVDRAGTLLVQAQEQITTLLRIALNTKYRGEVMRGDPVTPPATPDLKLVHGRRNA